MNVQGNPDLIEQPQRRGFDAQSGPFITRTWKGTEDACNAGMDEIAALADHAEVTGDGAVYTLTARFASSTGDPTDTTSDVPVHEERLHYNVILKNIYEHPKFAGIAVETKNDIRRFIDQGVELPFEITVPIEVTLLNLLKAGIESFPVNQAIVTVTDTASVLFPWRIGFTNVGRLLTTGGMIGDAELKSGWVRDLPASGNLFKSDGITPSGWAYGWHKGAPEINTVGGNRSQLSQQFEFGLWWVELFNGLGQMTI